MVAEPEPRHDLLSWQHVDTLERAWDWYGAWCLILWVLILLFVPETKVGCVEDRIDLKVLTDVE